MKTIKYVIHSNKYGWAIRLGGWTGPKLMQCDTKEQAIKIALEGARGVDWALEAAAVDELLVSN